MTEVFAPIAHICRFADTYNLPRDLDAINRICRRDGYPEFVPIGPGASMPLPSRRTHDVVSHRREMER